MTSTPSPRRLRRPHTRTVLALLVLAAVLAALLGACAGGNDGGDAGGPVGAAASELRAEEGVAAPDAAAAGGSEAAPAADRQVVVGERAVIATATVSVSAEDVAEARFEVQKITDEARGEVAEEQTEGGDEMRRSRLVVRVPSASFGETVAALEKVGSLESSTRKSEDVTTTVIDNEARIRAQEQSLRRVEVLLERATSIRDIVAIESQLTQRQAELDSLKSQQAFLADQTSLSTITVHIERSGEPGAGKPDTDRGFLTGLRAGWDSLTTFAAGALTIAGVLLPWAALLALLGVPTWLALRRIGRRSTPSPAGS